MKVATITIEGEIAKISQRSFKTKKGETVNKKILTLLSSSLKPLDIEVDEEDAKDLIVGEVVTIQDLGVTSRYYNEVNNRFEFARVKFYKS